LDAEVEVEVTGEVVAVQEGLVVVVAVGVDTDQHGQAGRVVLEALCVISLEQQTHINF